MIHELTDKALIPELVRMAGEMTSAPTRTLHNMLSGAIGSGYAKVFLEEVQGYVEGYIFATIERYNGEDAGFIQMACVRPTSKIGPSLLEEVEKWCKGEGLKNIYFICYRDPAPFCRKYKFSLHAYILKKES